MTYVPDQTQPLDTTLGGGGHFWEQTARLTWQVEPEEQVRLLLQQQEAGVHERRDDHARNEALATTYFFPFSDNLVQWSSPVTNKFLLEAGFWHHQETWGNKLADASIADPLAVGVTDNNPQTLTPGYTQLINNYHGRVGATDTGSHNPNYRGNFAASYVTGSHAFKAGMDLNGAVPVV